MRRLTRAMRVGLSKIQAKVLAAIRELTVDGVAPTLDELAERLGMKSRGQVHQHLSLLRKKGRLTWEVGVRRSIRIIEDGQPTELDGVSTVRLKGLIEETANALALDIGTTPAADYVASVLKRLREQVKRQQGRPG